MRTTVTIEDELYEEARAMADEKNVSAVITKALKSFIAAESKKRILRLSGKAPSFRLPQRKQTLRDLHAFPSVRAASFKETHVLLEEYELRGKGLQWNDLLILASVIISPGTLLWTQDKRLAAVAENLSVNYHDR